MKLMTVWQISQSSNMQVFVHFQRTSLLHFEDGKLLCGCDIRNAISQLEGVPRDCFYMQIDGKIIHNDEIVSTDSPVDVRISLRGLGGKGGFGAMLKSK